MVTRVTGLKGRKTEPEPDLRPLPFKGNLPECYPLLKFIKQLDAESSESQNAREFDTLANCRLAVRTIRGHHQRENHPLQNACSFQVTRIGRQQNSVQGKSARETDCENFAYRFDIPEYFALTEGR